MRWYSWAVGAALACAAQSPAAADKSLRPLDTPLQWVTPQRIMAVRWDAGRIVPVSPWVEYGDFIPTSPCQGAKRLCSTTSGIKCSFATAVSQPLLGKRHPDPCGRPLQRGDREFY